MDSQTWSPGTQVASYRLHQRRPRAWWGDEWQAVSQSQQEVWLWSLSRSSFPWVSDRGWDTFQEQAEELPVLSHPYVLPCLDSFPLSDEHWCLIWQAPQNTPSQPHTLEQLLKSEPAQCFDEDYATSLWEQLLKGLQHIHGRGLIHGCLSPMNLTIDWGTGLPEVRLSQVGLFSLLPSYHGSTPLSESSQSPVPPGYLAPERRRLSSSRIEHPRTDLYAAGGILWYMLTGSPPEVPLDTTHPTWQNLSSLTRHRLQHSLEPEPERRASHSRPLLQGTESSGIPAPRVDASVLEAKQTLPYSFANLEKELGQDTYAQQLQHDVHRLLESDPESLEQTQEGLEPQHEDDFLKMLSLDASTSTQQLFSPQNQRIIESPLLPDIESSILPEPSQPTLKPIPTDWEREALQADQALYRGSSGRIVLFLSLLLLAFLTFFGLRWIQVL